MQALQEMLLTLVQVVIVTAVPLITGFAVSFFKRFSANMAVQIQNERMKHYLLELNEAVSAAVAEISQIYVDELKKDGVFNRDEQLYALKSAKDSAITLLTPAARAFFNEAYGDIQKLLTAKIEEAVRTQKHG